MFSNKTRFRSGQQIHRLNKIRTLAVSLFFFIITVFFIFVITKVSASGNNITKELLRIWNTGDYEQVYEISRDALLEKPVDYFLLTMNGFSAYQMGISQINNQSTIFYIDESIKSLRKALLHKNSVKDARVHYVLGKAYSSKGVEYSDLAVKYLEYADNLSYAATDIPEYLGLAYAASGDYRKSVEAFSNALMSEKPTDNLLLSIARSYMAMNEFSMAIGYLKRCVDTSPDTKSINIARLMLAEIYLNSGDFDSAEIYYLSILNDSGENAEVRYQLGELFHLKGDSTRARAEWRIAYRQDPTHTKVRARLNI